MNECYVRPSGKSRFVTLLNLLQLRSDQSVSSPSQQKQSAFQEEAPIKRSRLQDKGMEDMKGRKRCVCRGVPGGSRRGSLGCI